jgi:ABC-type lipoprotein export system ATPase subunit
MIRLENIIKVYNKKQPNQLIVCNDMTLEFEETGLVCILGPSGSGKTTLLNIISGIDSFDKGKIYFDEIPITKYSQKKWDYIRKHKIGYVYQNYHLLNNQTAYQNIEPILKMQGLTDDETIRYHIERLLDTVGLKKYADRKIKQLSGGQQQRVAFARALANNPRVILADEPTGNLDSKNSIELMNIMKEASKEVLIIMVTHEKNLAEYYSDRIIEIENGTIIKDSVNTRQNKLDYLQEHIINLTEYKNQIIENDDIKINHYKDNDIKEKLDVDLIERNKTLYVKVNSKNLNRTKYIDSDSEISLKYKDSHKDSEDKSNKKSIYADYGINDDKKVFSFKDSFKFALRNLTKFNPRYKILFVVMFLVGIIISISVGLLGEVYFVEEPFSIIDANYITVHVDRTQYDDYKLIEEVEGVDQLMLVSSPYTFQLNSPKYYEMRIPIDVSAQPIDIKFFDEETLIYGSLPKDYEIIIDMSVADSIINENIYRGIETYDDVLNCSFRLFTSGVETSTSIDSTLDFKISGIADANSRSVWMKEELIYSITTPWLTDHRVLGDNFKIISGELPTSTTYVMLNENYPDVLLGKIPYSLGIATGTYYISGIYSYEVDGVSFDFQKAVISNLEYIKDKYYIHQYHRHTDFDLLVYTDDVSNTLINLKEAGFEASANIFIPADAQYQKIKANMGYYLIGLGCIVISSLSILLVVRSSLISRTHEISVYRNIGVSRKEIRRIFALEIVLTTTFSCVVGFLLMTFLLIQSESVLGAISIVHYTIPVTLLVILGLYIINLIFGLLPINILLNKTPANIMKKSDL